jgi:hypothetical protein
MRKAVSMIVCLVTAVSCLGATASKEVRSVFYADQLGDTFNLNAQQRAKVYELHMQKLEGWDEITVFDGTPAFGDHKRRWVMDFRDAILGEIGRDKQGQWAEFNKMIRSDLKDPNLEDRIDPSHLNLYASTGQQNVSFADAPAVIPSSTFENTPATIPVSSPAVSFQRQENVTDTMHNRASHFAVEAGLEFRLSAEQQQEAYNLHILNIRCWQEVDALREKGELLKVEEYSKRVNEAYMQSLLRLIGQDKEVYVTAFKNRMYWELKDIK